jgi:hypothetical protein
MPYAFRWLALLFAREHPLWDELLPCPGEIVEYARCAALGHLRQTEGLLGVAGSGRVIRASATW